MTGTLLIVTPMHNEEEHVRELHRCLAAQTFGDFVWVVVDDGSTDGTQRELDSIEGSRRPHVMQRRNGGGLIGGSAYGAWRHGVDAARESIDCQYVMKLDADVRLPATYLETVIGAMSDRVGIAGGVITSRGMAEQLWHVPGPVKMYTTACYDALQNLPSAIGFDVMDEVAAASVGLATRVVFDAPFELARSIGASEGGVHGRYRNGRVCRWTGYDPLYFGLHVVRYAFRAPLGVGACAMVVGYARAGHGPYLRAMRRLHASSQRHKLREALSSPRDWLARTYSLAAEPSRSEPVLASGDARHPTGAM